MNPPTYEVCFGRECGRCISVVAGAAGIWTFRFVCGDRPIAAGGAVSFYCEVPKFWLGINLQTEDPAADEYISVRVSKGRRFELRDVPAFYKTLLWARVHLPDGLLPGEEVLMGVGTEAAPAYAIAHSYPEAPISVTVDYFGDGSHFKLWPPIVVTVVPGPAAKLAAVLPSRIGAGEEFEARLRAEDANSNIGARLDSPVRFALTGPDGFRQERTARLDAAGIGRVEGLRVSASGIYRAEIESGNLRALSNPMECVAGKTESVRVFWGDLHNHTGWADGVGTFRHNIDYARDAAFLDVFSFAEHVGAGASYSAGPFDKGGNDWALLGPETADIANRENRPGRFATILACEYTPRGKAHFPDGDHCVFSPSDRWTDMPMFVEQEDLMAMARKAGCLVIPHVGGRTPNFEEYNWDPNVTPLLEIAGMHEHSEYYLQQALQKGFKVGVCGMSDGHFGKPGYDCWALHGRTPGLKRRNFSVQSALTAFCAKELTREAAFQAMARRHTYATTGERILLDFSLDGSRMGSDLTSRGKKPRISIRAHGTAPIARVDLIRGDRRVASWQPEALDFSTEWEDAQPVNGETWYYVRVTQRNFAYAWSSPVQLRYESADGAAPDEIARLPLWNSGPEWPDADPAGCDPARTEALIALLRRRGIHDRFKDAKLAGVFSECRGRFSFFRGTDAADGLPVHIHHYFDFPDGRLYVARGHSDYGQLPAG